MTAHANCPLHLFPAFPRQSHEELKEFRRDPQLDRLHPGHAVVTDQPFAVVRDRHGTPSEVASCEPDAINRYEPSRAVMGSVGVRLPPRARNEPCIAAVKCVVDVRVSCRAQRYGQRRPGA